MVDDTHVGGYRDMQIKGHRERGQTGTGRKHDEEDFPNTTLPALAWIPSETVPRWSKVYPLGY